MKRCHFCFRRLPLFTLLRRALLLSVCSLIVATVHGAPVTLQFDAVVGPLLGGLDAPLPPSWNTVIQQGDAISGTFTFEPFDAATNTYQTTLVELFDFSIHIKNATLTSSQYAIRSRNNGYIIDDEGVLVDSLSVACHLSAQCIPNPLPDGTTWRFHLALSGDSSVLDGADIPADPIAWQQLSSGGSLNVTFFDSDAQRIYGFQADPRFFRVVPEPASAALLVLAVAIMFAVRSESLNILQMMRSRR